MNTTSTATVPNLMNDIVARQRQSRLRDATFSILLAIGIGLSLGALRAAAAEASAPVSAIVTPSSVATSTPAVCQVELTC